MKRGLKEIKVCFAAYRLLCSVQEQRSPGMYRWVNVTKIPFISWHLPAWMKIKCTEHQLHLLFCEIGVNYRKRKCMERKIPGRIPWVFPFVGHRNNFFI